MEILDAIRKRRAVRDYKQEAVDPGLLRQLVAAASWAPSAMNEQPWHFTIITDAKLLDEISAASKEAMLESMANLPRPGHFQDILADPGFHIFYHAPVLIVISAPADSPWGTEDCALAAQNLMLAACDLELGTCWIGFAQGWLNSGEGRQVLGLPAGHRAAAPIIVGHPKTALSAVPRKTLAIRWIADTKVNAHTDVPASMDVVE